VIAVLASVASELVALAMDPVARSRDLR
jgi:hypothetical protein